MQQFRTTISAVYWSDSPEEAQATVDAVNAALPEEAQGSTLATIEYKAEGPPVTP